MTPEEKADWLHETDCQGGSMHAGERWRAEECGTCLATALREARDEALEEARLLFWREWKNPPPTRDGSIADYWYRYIEDKFRSLKSTPDGLGSHVTVNQAESTPATSTAPDWLALYKSLAEENRALTRALNIREQQMAQFGVLEKAEPVDQYPRVDPVNTSPERVEETAERRHVPCAECGGFGVFVTDYAVNGEHCQAERECLVCGGSGRAPAGKETP